MTRFRALQLPAALPLFVAVLLFSLTTVPLWAAAAGEPAAAAALTSDRLYRNRGDGTFEDVSGLLGDKLQGAAFSASFVDYDNDGDADIYVVNDKVENPIGNVLWRNDGSGCGGWCWSDASRETRTDAVRNGMGLAVGDYDNDGWLDLFLAATGYAPRFSDPGAPIDLLFLPHPNVLFRNPVRVRSGVIGRRGDGGTGAWAEVTFGA